MVNKIVEDNIVMENARIIFKNFSGKPGKFNKDGQRNFALIIPDPQQAENLMNEGWNIRVNETWDDQPVYYLNVSVAYNHSKPMIILVSGNNRTLLDEDTVEMLDWAEILNIDLIIRPYNWEINGNKGVKAYLKTMYVTIEADPFQHKYQTNNPELEEEPF